MSHDNGFDKAPTRYTQEGRETVDRMRDLVHEAVDAAFSNHTEEQRQDIADTVFGIACLTHAIKYQDRKGAKGDLEGDRQKARWWSQMGRSLQGHGTDPRAGRPDFQPYVRRRFTP